MSIDQLISSRVSHTHTCRWHQKLPSAASPQRVPSEESDARSLAEGRSLRKCLYVLHLESMGLRWAAARTKGLAQSLTP